MLIYNHKIIEEDMNQSKLDLDNEEEEKLSLKDIFGHANVLVQLNLLSS